MPERIVPKILKIEGDLGPKLKLACAASSQAIVVLVGYLAIVREELRGLYSSLLDLLHSNHGNLPRSCLFPLSVALKDINLGTERAVSQLVSVSL